MADGARSELREAVRPGRAKRYPWGALWFVAQDPEQRFAGRLHQIAESTTTLLGFLPSGSGPRGAGGVPRVSLFWSLPAKQAEQRSIALGAWKRRVLQLEPIRAALSPKPLAALGG